MTFLCPSCHQTVPLADGQLVIGQNERPKHMRGRYNLAPPTVVILCAPCTADLVLVRAGLR